MADISNHHTHLSSHSRLTVVTMLSVRHEEQHYTVVILETLVFGQSFQFSGHNLDRKFRRYDTCTRKRNYKVKKIK